MDDAALRELISGRKRGLLAATLRGTLSVLSCFYGLGVCVRNVLYARRWRPVHRAPVPVISVGNLTAGGTGKTPLVAYLCRWISAQGERPGILSRGYRALEGGANDEKLLLDRLCPDVPHVQDRDRCRGAEKAVREHGVSLLVLDDGFQHRRIHRDLDIVLIDALLPFGYEKLLPRGLLREPLSSLERADAVLVTRADLASREQLDAITQQIAAVSPGVPVFEVGFRPLRLVNAGAETAGLDELTNRRVLAFCGIGNPQGFRETLRGLNADVATLLPFPDHHDYTDEDVALLESLAETYEVEMAVTTAKDLVKLSQTELAHRPLWAIDIEADFGPREAEFQALVLQALRGKAVN